MNECLEHRSLVALSFYCVCVHLTSCWNNAYVKLILQGYYLPSVCSYFIGHCTFVIGKEDRRRLFSFLFLNSLYWNYGGRIFKVHMLSVDLTYLCIPNSLVSWIVGMDFFALLLFFFFVRERGLSWSEWLWGRGSWWYLCVMEIDEEVLFSSCRRFVEPGKCQVPRKAPNLEVNALKVWCHFPVNYLIIEKGYQTFTLCSKK